MAALRASSRLQVGSTAWIKEEKTSALQIADSEVEEFAFSARNELDWLNEHMADIFNDENHINMIEIFKTPGKLRGKTPRTAKKRNPLEERVPLSDAFTSTPKPAPSPFRQLPQSRLTPIFQVAEDAPETKSRMVASPLSRQIKDASRNPHNDSGYHGSQSTEVIELQETEIEAEISKNVASVSQSTDIPQVSRENIDIDIREDSVEDVHQSPKDSFRSAKENQTADLAAPGETAPSTSPVRASPKKYDLKPASPQKVLASSPRLPAHPSAPVAQEFSEDPKEVSFEDSPSASDGSSPMRPPVRQGSLNFPSLPAREPLATKKSLGTRASNQADQNRTSYFGRSTGGKSMGARLGNGEDDVMDLDGPSTSTSEETTETKIMQHHKTSTQRLQDQISMLGKLQPTRTSKSIANTSNITTSHTALNSQEATRAASPKRNSKHMTAPGAFPTDDDDWIAPPAPSSSADQTSRPFMIKAFSADVVEGVHGKDSISGSEFNVPKQRREELRLKSPLREPTVPERTTSVLGHQKSVSTSVLRSPFQPTGEIMSPKKQISVSNPSMRSNEVVDLSTSPPKSPARSIKESPLKAAKDKLSSILKSSKGLFASSAAVVAEGEKAAQSPTAAHKFLMQHAPSMESLTKIKSNESASLYPDLRSPLRARGEDPPKSRSPESPTRSLFRKTRASTEREREEKQKEKEAKEKQRMDAQLEKAREKEREKARVFSEEKERVAAMEKKVAAQKEQEKLAKAARLESAKPTRTSPRKAKAQVEAEETIPVEEKDVEMTDAPSVMAAPASITRPTTAQSMKAREQAKRPVRPGKETNSKSKAPVIIRVNTGSQHPGQFHPSNTSLAATLGESLAPSTASSSSHSTLKTKASTTSLHSKASTTFNKSISAATGKPKALEAAARKKEQDEREAQRKRDAKLEIERKRAAMAAAAQEEEKRLEQQRKLESEQQRQRDRDQTATIEAKKAAQRQAIEKRRLEIERAKQQRAPPPASRPGQNADSSRSTAQTNSQRSEAPTRPGTQRINSVLNRSQEEISRPGNPVLQNAAKAPPKRPMQQDQAEEAARSAMRNGPNYQQNEQKRRRTSEGYNDDTEPQPKTMAPPVRQSSNRPKDAPTKSFFASGYANASQSSHNAQLLQKPAMHQPKTAHPLDMTQTSKAPIIFAPGMNSAAGPSYKTPARPAGTAATSTKSNAKSVARSSPRFQNSEHIELPEIHTDSEDDDSDAGTDFVVPDWANSPAIRAQLVAQDSMDPSQVFGPIAPLQMEEVFRNKDRWHRFRARTSSANWSGADRLTEDEIRKDLEAREKLRRDGGWSYGLS